MHYLTDGLEQSRNLGLSFLNLIIIYSIILAILFLIVRGTEDHPFNLYISILWSLYIPAAILGVIGALKSRKISASTEAIKCYSKLHVVIPTVGTSGVMAALNRVITSIYECSPKYFNEFSVDVVIDEHTQCQQEIENVLKERKNSRLIIVPAQFRCANGALAKARALEYAREERRKYGESGKDEFIYHLDDDTSVSPETMASIANFINNEGRSYDLAQGILTFPHSYSKSGISKIADSVRPSDDLTRFYFFTGFLHMPLGGLHGEHLLIRASVEDQIGWDFGPTKVEDSAFGMEFVKYFGRRSYFLPSRVTGASPQSVRDFIKQRRRWYSGIISLAFNRRDKKATKIPLMAFALLTMFSPMQYILVVLIISAIISTQALPVSLLFLPVWSFNFAYQLWLYEEGYNMNREESKRLRKERSWMRFLTIPLIYISGSMEALAVALGVLDYLKKDSSFEVIEKPL